MLKSFGAVCAAVSVALTMPALAQTAAPAEPTVATGNTLIAVATADPELSTFARLATSAGLDKTLSSAGPLTVLAPSNDAFAKLPADQLAELGKPENAAKLQRVLLYHVIPAAAPSSAIKGTRGEEPSATPDKLSLDGTGDAVKINGATVVRADVTASNGLIHIVDTVLMPSTATSAAGAEAGTTAPIPPN